MLKLSYGRLIRARYSHLGREGLPLPEPRELQKVLELPHPQREAAFIEWSLLSYRHLLQLSLISFLTAGEN